MRKESESCESCINYTVSIALGYGVCVSDPEQSVSMDEDQWCSKYDYDGLPLNYITMEESHADSQ